MQRTRYSLAVVAYMARIIRQAITSSDVRWSLEHHGPANRRSIRAWLECLVDDYSGLQELAR